MIDNCCRCNYIMLCYYILQEEREIQGDSNNMSNWAYYPYGEVSVIYGENMLRIYDGLLSVLLQIKGQQI